MNNEEEKKYTIIYQNDEIIVAVRDRTEGEEE